MLIFCKLDSREPRATRAILPSGATRTEKMSRLYVIESTPSATGAKADHRLPVRAGDSREVSDG